MERNLMLIDSLWKIKKSVPHRNERPLRYKKMPLKSVPLGENVYTTFAFSLALFSFLLKHYDVCKEMKNSKSAFFL